MRNLLYVLVFCILSSAHAQQPRKLNSAEIYEQIRNLNFLGTALYVGAHPDDENTRLISYLSNELHARTAYLSLTRGDGGQNLIGPELRELLGVIRTQELLAARRIDGGEQFFTRANDFGYSKHPDETLSIWDEQEVLSDMVWTIRKFKPDVIINRFNHETAGETHGHHTSSALLSLKAFEAAWDQEVFPSQVERQGTWKPQRLFFNTSHWFYGSQEAFDQADKSNFLELDIGTYFPLKGLSNTEIASLSRSQHQSQGFGSTGTRGSTTEYIELIAGDHPGDSNRIFEGINTTWSRVRGGKDIGQILRQVEENYDFKDPAASIPKLVEAYKLIMALKDPHWKQIKSQQVKEIIAACAGLYMEALSDVAMTTRNTEVSLELEVINRSNQEMHLESVEILTAGEPLLLAESLENNQPWNQEVSIRIPGDADYTTPYWLKKEGSIGMYAVEDQELIGLPESRSPFHATFRLNVQGVSIPFSRPITYKENDPVKGEVYYPFEIIPDVSTALASSVVIFADERAKTIPVTLTAAKDSLRGTLTLDHPTSWKITPESHEFELSEKGSEKTFVFRVTPPNSGDEGIIAPRAEIQGEVYSRETLTLDYGHIPVQTLILPSRTKVVKLDIEKEGTLVGYIQGAGDVVPQGLEQIGYRVVTLDPGQITAGNLERFDAVVMGIRSYNTVEELSYKQGELMEYVEDGGTLIVQYNTSRGLITRNLAPYPLQLSSNRVTDENAEVRILEEDHPVLNYPNKITSEDFQGWVQERGLYFPDQWSAEFTPVLSMNDPGETPKKGSLLIAPYGKGHYIYTGLSFFREFPAGVPGAFRLFANLISLGSETKKTTSRGASPSDKN